MLIESRRSGNSSKVDYGRLQICSSDSRKKNGPLYLKSFCDFEDEKYSEIFPLLKKDK